MELPRLGVLAILGGILLAGFVQTAVPAPESLEQWMCCNGNGGRYFATRGPMDVRYDEARDVTYAVFPCAHGACDAAVTLDGDARELVDASSLLLMGVYSPPPRGLEPLRPAIEVETFSGSQEINQTTANVFHVVPRTLHILLRDAAFLLVGLGMVAAWGATWKQLGGATMGGIAGLGLGLPLAQAGIALAMIPIMVVPFALGAAALLAFVRARWRWAPGVAYFLGLLGAGVAFPVLTQGVYFPGPPLA